MVKQREEMGEKAPSDELSAAPAVEVAAMDKHLIRGILWTAASKWSSQIVSWGSLIVITRFVSPSDFGLVAMATAYLQFSKIISQSGFGSAAITLRSLGEQEIRQINTFSVLAATIMCLLSCAVANPLGAFFHSPHLPVVVAVMSITVLLGGVQTIPFSLLQRDFRFKLLSTSQAASSLVQAIFTLILAYLGYGYWALVDGILVGAILSAGVPVFYAPQGFSWPRSKSIHHALRFSWEVLISHLSWAFYTDADFLVAGRALGSKVLGEYSLSWTVATLPVEKVTTLVGQVTPAVFSARQTDYSELCRYVLVLTEGLSIITFPMGVGLALTAREAVPLLFGPVWVGAVLPLQILAILGCARSVSTLMSPLLTAVRSTRYLMLTNVSAAVLMPCAFYFGSHWGPAGIATAWIFGFPIILLSLYGRAFRITGLDPINYFKALQPALTGVVVMAVAVEIIKGAVLDRRFGWISLLAEMASGVAVYCGVLFLLHRDRVRAVARWYRHARAPSSPPNGGVVVSQPESAER